MNTKHYTLEGKIEGVDVTGKTGIFKYLRTQYEAPKTYKKIGIISRQEYGTYESGLVTVYKAKNGELRFELYHDGNFYPYFGKLNIEKGVR